MSRKFKIISLNVRGLQNQNKRGAIFSYLKSQKATLYCLQETYSLSNDEKVWPVEWGGQMIFSHGTAHSKGVCMLLNPNSTFQLCNIQTDPQGRFIIIAKITIDELPFFVVNIYAPNDYREQEMFIHNLTEHIISKSDTSRLIVSGDWNVTLNRTDKQGGLPWKATAYRNAVVDLIDELNLIDIYRHLHPNAKTFTYESKTLKLKSRIDFFLVSHAISLDVLKSETRASIAPDHKSIFLCLEIKSEFKRGPGLWKFNNTLLEDDSYKELIEFKYPLIQEKYSELSDKQLLWELIKMELRSTTIKYSKQKRSDLKTKEQSLQKELQELDSKICNDCSVLDKAILDRYETAKEELKKIHESRGKEAMFRSKTKWMEHGEKPTKYFYKLEKTNYDKKCIREIKLENEEITSNLALINKEIENFYKNMYTSKVDNMQSSQASKGFNDYIKDINSPRLSMEEQEDLDQSLTCQELKDALNCLAENKTPGEDGFTKEFYAAFFDLRWSDLLNSYNEAFSKGTLSISQRRGTITLLPKGDTYLTDLTNWRPISLLNIDYKILAKILALRLE